MSIQEKARHIDCLICDVDGVLTDGFIYIDNHANEFKTFNTQDGVGLKLLMAVGIHVAVITGSKGALIDHRMAQLGIVHYYKGCSNKQQAYDDLKSKLSCDDMNIAYIGDDLPDLPIMRQVGLSAAVANAVHQLKQEADFETALRGGQGAVRELCELILNAQGKLELAITGLMNL